MVLCSTLTYCGVVRYTALHRNICAVHCAVYNVSFSVQCEGCGVQCSVKYEECRNKFSVQCVVCNVQYWCLVSGEKCWCAVCCGKCVMGIVQRAVCSLRCTVRSV